MAIFRGAGGPGDATTDAANEASVASTKAAEAEASATAAASSAISASNSATTAINSKDAAATSESNAATSALAASTSEDNASTSASAADTSATAAQTAQTAAEAAKTAAETAETGAEVAQTAAESAQTAAELAQTGAETAETNAETAQAAAESALASTLSTLDEFDDIYLGAKASPPNTDNDGNTLQTGAIYWDTGDNQLYIWDGANWDAAAFNVTGAVTSFNTRTGAVTLQNDDVTTAVGQSLQVGDSPTFVGVTATGNIAVTGTVDGRDVATDGTKLDGIEANADVTDTTNVTAAGAVMDSELTSEASVKALDQGVATTDSPSFAGLTVDTDTLYVDSTNNRVGIGTTSPAVDLDIENSDTAIIQLKDTGDTRSGAIKVRNGDLTLVNGIGVSGAGTERAKIVLSDNSFMSFDTGATERMRINSSGNVGIGTTSPTSSKLHIDGGDLRIQDVTPNIYFYSEGAVNNVQINANISDVAQGGIAIYENSNALIKSRTNYTQFYSANTERMRIDSSGNVLIGATATASTSYGAKFLKDGASSEILAIHRQASDGDFIQFARGGNASGNIKHSSGNLVINAVNDFQIETNDGTNAVHIDTTGNVGIGTNSPAAQLDVVGTVRLTNTANASNNSNIRDGGGLVVEAGNSNPLYFYTGGSEKARITSAGNVGIGTASPSQKLTVNGTDARIYLTGANTDINMDNSASGQLSLDGNAYAFGIALNSSGANLYTNSVSRNLIFGVNETEVMRVTNGNVGIGTSSPLFANSNLNVVQGVVASNDGAINPYFQTYNSNAGTNLKTWRFGGQDDGKFLFQTVNDAYSVSTNRMSIDSSGNVGIGTASPSTLLHLKSAGPAVLTLEADSDNVTETDNARIELSQDGGGVTGHMGYASNTNGISIWNNHSDYVRFGTLGTERMRIDSSGDVFWGTTSTPDVKNESCVTFEPDIGRVHINANSTAVPLELNQSAPDTLTRSILRFHRNEAIVGSVTASTTGVNYNESSDYRLKENVTLITDAVDRLKQLKPSRFNFIVEPDRTVDGFIAHEVQAVVPQAVMGDKDEVDADGNPVMQGIDQSKLVPLLTAALQEAITKIEALEARVTALESN